MHVRICSVSDTLHALQWCDLSGVACPVACDVQAVRVRWGWGLHLGGMGPEARVGAVSPVTTEKIKKAQKITPTPIANLENFPQK